MGQKSQPISLRLQKTNRSFDSCWFSDFYYSDILKREIETQFFINSISKQIQYGSGRFFILNFPKKAIILFFFLDPNKSRFTRSKIFRLAAPKKILSKQSSFFPQPSEISGFHYEITNAVASLGSPSKGRNATTFGIASLPSGVRKAQSALPFGLPSSGYSFASTERNASNPKEGALADHAMETKSFPLWAQLRNTNQKQTSLLPSVNSLVPHRSFQINSIYQSRLESILSSQFHSNLRVQPIRSVSSFQSALFVAQEIVYYLEKRIPFRKIKNSIFKELKFHPEIKGIRLACSGRVGRIQRAKIEYVKSGQTPLNLFSSKIDFASLYGTTPFGLVGIKVWICFS